MTRWMEQQGGSAGRGSHEAATEASGVVERTRSKLATLLGTQPDGIVWTQNGTEAINLPLLGLLKPGDHVVTTVTEHNSVLRPLEALRRHRQVEVSHVECDRAGCISVDSVLGELTQSTRLVVISHVSNVTGAIQPWASLIEPLKERGTFLMIDAAQSTGHLELDLGETPVDCLASSGHKGLLGPLGTGFVYMSPEIREKVEPLRYGGTGSQSHELTLPERSPERFEAGNLNGPALAGLEAALDYRQEVGPTNMHAHLDELTGQMRQGLAAVPGVSLLAPTKERHSGPVSFTAEGFDSREFATILEASFGIQVRAGYHCAALIHERIGSATYGGTVRASLGPFNKTEDVGCLVEAVREVTGGC